MLTPNSPWDPLRGGVGQVFFYSFSGQFMTFPGLLIFCPLKIPLGPPGGGVGQLFLGANQSHIYPNMCGKVGRGLTVVSEKGGTDRQTDKGKLQLYTYYSRLYLLCINKVRPTAIIFIIYYYLYWCCVCVWSTGAMWVVYWCCVGGLLVLCGWSTGAGLVVYLSSVVVYLCCVGCILYIIIY